MFFSFEGLATYLVSIWEGWLFFLFLYLEGWPFIYFLFGRGWPPIYFQFGRGWPPIYFSLCRGWSFIYFLFGFYLGGDCQIVCFFYLEQLATYLVSIWEGMVFVFLFGGAGHLSSFYLGGGGFCFSIWRGWPPINFLFERG